MDQLIGKFQPVCSGLQGHSVFLDSYDGNELDWTVLGVKWKLKLSHASYKLLPYVYVPCLSKLLPPTTFV